MAYSFDKIVVIGAGTMGAAIAAHFANVGRKVTLLDIVPAELTAQEAAKGLSLSDSAVRNRFANAGLERVKKDKPGGMYSGRTAERISTGNLEDNFDVVGEADWILEAIVENLKIKRDLMARIDAARRPESIVSTNTSGLPIASIAEGRSEGFKSHFLGTHFFNPPRYLKLLEIIPTADTDPKLTETVSRFGEEVLGKGAVLCKDRPNFIANRLGVHGSCITMRYAVENGYTVEEVDLITGSLTGHPDTGTFRLGDLVGLDVMYHVTQNLYEAVPEDEEREALNPPDVLRELVKRGWTGNKVGQGFYRKAEGPEGRQFYALDLQTMEHRPPQKAKFDSVDQARRIESLPERLRFLVSQDDRAGKFVWHVTARALAYAARRVPEIAGDVVSLDNAMKWGYAHELGPFEVWDALGVETTATRMEQEGIGVAPWVKEMIAAGNPSFYRRDKSGVAVYDPAAKSYKELRRRPDVIVLKDLKDAGKEVDANAGASLIDLGDGVLCLEFHSKANSLDPDIGTMMNRAVEEAERNYRALVIGNQGQHFCAGANLMLVAMAAQQGMCDQIDQMVTSMQNSVQSLHRCKVPVVAAPFSMALAGGSEVCLGADRIVAAAETYMGQVEVGVGLVPAAGGCKELLRRILSPAMKTESVDPLPFVQRVFELIGMAKVSTSAEEAREMGFLSDCDHIVIGRDLLLASAKRVALEMATAGYYPRWPEEKVYAAGEGVLAALKVGLHLMKEAGQISEHDALIGRKLAWVLCGGDITSPRWVEPQYILDLERQAFVSLCKEPKTIERIWHMLSKGRPLRN